MPMSKALTAASLGACLLFSAMSLPALAAKAYVSNEKDNSISVIDTDTLEVVNTFDVGQRPRGILLNSTQDLLYVCASDSDTVQVFDVASGELVKELPSGEDPEQFALHPNDRWLYIANEDDALVTIIDVETSEVLGQIEVGLEPEGMAVSHNGKWAVATSETTNMVHWINTETNTLDHNTVVDQRPRVVVFNADDSLLWASAEIGGTVSVMDVDSKEIVQKIEFEVKGQHPDQVQPVGIALTRDGKTAFVALGPSNHVAVVNAETYEVEDYLLVGRRVWQLGFNADQSLLFTTNGVSGDVSVVDVADRTVVKSIKVGRYPWGVVVTD